MGCRFGPWLPWLKAAQQVPKPSEKCAAWKLALAGIEDSSRFSCQTVLMFLVKKGMKKEHLLT